MQHYSSMFILLHSLGAFILVDSDSNNSSGLVDIEEDNLQWRLSHWFSYSVIYILFYQSQHKIYVLSLELYILKVWFYWIIIMC